MKEIALVREAAIPLVERAAKRLTPLDSFTRMDGTSDPVITELVQQIRLQFTERFTVRNTGPQLLNTLKKLGSFNSRDLSRILRIDIRADLGLGQIVDAFMRDNLKLIQGVSMKTAGEIGAILDAGAGRRAEDLMNDIMDRFDVTETRAALIARDQVLKKNGELHRIRQTRAGIVQYEWVDSGDERVRPEHQEADGQIFQWAIPPELTGGHPGQPVQCRCTAMPVLPGDSLDDEGDDE